MRQETPSMIKPILNGVLADLKNRFKDELVSVVLFGSRARGTHKDSSDIDLIIVLKYLPGVYRENSMLKNLRMSILLKHGIRLDTHLFTPQEIIDNFNSFSPMFATTVLGNEILYDAGSFFKKNYYLFLEQLKKEHVRYGEGEKVWNLSKIAKNTRISL